MTDAPTKIWAWIDYDGNVDGHWINDAGAQLAEPPVIPDAYTLTSFHEGKINLRDEEIERLRKAVGRFRTAIRVNCLRHGGTHEDADKVIAACEKGQPHD